MLSVEEHRANTCCVFLLGEPNRKNVFQHNRPFFYSFEMNSSFSLVLLLQFESIRGAHERAVGGSRVVSV